MKIFNAIFALGLVLELFSLNAHADGFVRANVKASAKADAYANVKVRGHKDKHANQLIIKFIDAESKAKLPMTTVELVELNLWTFSDVDGLVYINNLKEGKKYIIKASYMGYFPKEVGFEYHKNIKQKVIELNPRSFAFNEVIVTAEQDKKESGTVKIRKDALEFIQPTGLRDVLSLLPGGLVVNPGLKSVQQATLREAGLSSNSALGTAIIVDGVPQSNDVNLRGFANRNQRIMSTSTMNSGLDLREFSVEHIDNIEVIQGVASAKYGNLTSGAIILHTKAGVSPYEIRIQADPYTKLFSLGKGFKISDGRTLYAGVDYTSSNMDLRNPIRHYNRLTGLFRYSYTGRGEKSPKVNISLNYTGNLDKRKYDPEVMVANERYKSNYSKTSFNINFSKAYGKNARSFINAVASASYVNDVVKQAEYITPRGGVTLPVATESNYDSGIEGVPGGAEGHYLESSYFSEFKTDSNPLLLYAQVRNTNRFTVGSIEASLLTGFDYRYEKNLGDGVVYDLLLPPNPGSPSSSRPLAYKDIPAIAPLAVFAEQNLKFSFGNGWENTTRIGIRATYDTGLAGRGYYLSNKILPEPRVYTNFSVPKINILGQPLFINVSLGYGAHTKLPTLAYLHPETAYYDLIEANYYHSKEENRLLWVKTYVCDRVNKKLRANKEEKYEFGVDFSYRGFDLKLNAFKHFTNLGFDNEPITIYTPYIRYNYDGVLCEGKPTLDLFTPETHELLSLMYVPQNSIKTVKRGIEYVLSTPKINPIRTRFLVQGVYYKTLYANSIPTAHRPMEVFDGKVFPYIGFYTGLNDRNRYRFHTLLRADTHIPEFKMLFSLTAQSIWFVKSRSKRYSGLPDYWIKPGGEPLSQGIIMRGDELNTDDKLEKRLCLRVVDRFFDTNKSPISVSVNLKLTKEIGKKMKVSFFVNNLFTYDPIHDTNLKTHIQYRQTPFFGSEIRIKI